MSWDPLFGSLLTSSILHEGPLVVAVWALFMASADRNGESDLTVPFVASVLNIPVTDAETAFDRLSAPDPHSRTSDSDGRRIVRRDDGRWFLPSHAAHRERMSKALAVARTQRYRARKAANTLQVRASSVSCATPGCKNQGIVKTKTGYVCTKCAIEGGS